MSNREHRRANKHEREKKVRDAIKRYKKLHRAQYWEPVYEELEEPVFWGYSREFVLRGDIALRNDASKWRTILNLVQNLEYSKRKDFKKRKWPSRRWQDQEHHLKALYFKEFQEKVPLKLRVHFQQYYDHDRNLLCYQFLHPWMFVSRTRKSYDTHRKVLDLELEWELAYLDQRIEQNLYRYAWCRQTGKGINWHWKRHSNCEREKQINEFHRAEVREALLMRAEGEEPSNLNF